MENRIEIVWTRADFERVIGKPLTDREWEVIASEVEGDIEEVYIPQVITSKASILEHLVAQDDKYEQEN